MKGKRVIAGILLVGIIAVTLTGCKHTDSSKKETEKPVITLGSDNYPPYNYLNEDGVPTGIDVELATEAFKRMGYQVDVVQINWEKKKELVESGEIDCIMGCFSMEGRLDDYRWAGPYIASRQVVYKYAVDGYSTEKTVIVFVMCLLKSVDAAEDVYHGLYQQQGRLDIAAKLQTIRMVGTILSFAAGLIVFRNLLTALILATVVSAVLVFGLIAVTLPEFQDKTASSITGAEARKKTVGLLKICFPLFAGTFLSFYIGNAPKYAIDKLLSEEVQACYGFISMPVFVINLLNGFIYQPILNKLAVDWSMGKKADFIKKVVRQFACVVGITVAAVAGGYLLGIPVLSILYNTDLKGYRMDLIILLLGGGMLALSGFLVIVLTIMRKQRNTIFGYALIAVLAYLFSEVFVRRYEVRGASMLYLDLMSGLTLIFLLMLILELVKMRKAK